MQRFQWLDGGGFDVVDRTGDADRAGSLRHARAPQADQVARERSFGSAETCQRDDPTADDRK